jgi:hypothetical protein
MAAGDITADRAEASDMYGASFDGVDDKITFPNISNFSANNGFTASFWIFCKSASNDIFNKWSSVANQRSIKLGIDANNKIVFSADDDGLGGAGVGIVTSTTALILKKWYHILINYDKTNLKVYINSVLDGAPAAQAQIYINNTVFSLGGLLDYAYFNGLIHNFKVWDKVLSASEIALDYAGTNVSHSQILWVPLCCDYNDKSRLELTGTNSGTYLTKSDFNATRADLNSLNLAAVTDKIIAVPIEGRDGQIAIVGANRAAA